MPSASREPFSDAQLQAIEEAVGRAEKVGGGEIVVYLTQASDEYHLAAWKGAALGSLALAMAATLGFASVDRWDLWIEAWLIAPAALGAALGFLAGRLIEPCRRLLIDRELMEERVERRAAEVFLAEEVFATRHRDGVLLFVSQFERRVALLADSGVSGRVPREAWDTVTRALTEAMHGDRAQQGLVTAVAELGKLLARYRTGSAGENELDDAPRVGGGL